MRILFVCLGNICRSPTAEGVMRRLVADAGLERDIEIESAGTGSWHVGHPPDERATSAAAVRGIELVGEARRVTSADFDGFDLLIAMDRSNRDALLELAPNDEARRRVFLLRQFGEGKELDVPDPYYGGADGFEEVLDIVERSCAALLDEVREQLRSRSPQGEAEPGRR
jgi:protein-tyrosine phosphatase